MSEEQKQDKSPLKQNHDADDTNEQDNDNDYFGEEEAERYFAELDEASDEEDTEKPKKHHTLATFIIVCIMIVAVGIGSYWLIVSNNRANQASQPSKQQTVADTDKTIAAVKSSVVLVTAESKTTTGNIERIKRSSGSGVIIAQDGYIITCEHVVAGAQTVSVRTIDNRVYWANVRGTDAENDVALLKINADNLTVASTGDVNWSLIGKKVDAIGNPGGTLSDTVSEGILYAVRHPARVEGRHLTLMLSSAQVSPGCSGGGLFTPDGKLIGMIDAEAGLKGIRGSHFCCAIPIDTVMGVVGKWMQE